MKHKKKQEKTKLSDFENHKVEKINSLEGYPEIKGIDLENDITLNDFIKQLGSNGFQATNIGKAIEVTKAMIREKATIFLSFTSNQISCGNREIIKHLVKHKLVHVIATTAGGIEEDIIKCFKPFVIGEFDVPGKVLFDKGINRTGNIFVPSDRYLYFEKFMNEFLEECYQKQLKTKKVLSVKEIMHDLGLKINDKNSYLYWAAKNDIPVFCPALTDGSFGDMLYFFKYRRPDFLIDITQDIRDIVNIALNSEKTGCIILGGGVAKHHVLNANIYREGCEYLVLINTGEEYDGSDSGARVEESIAWGKVKHNALQVKVHCDASIAFPLIIAGALKSKKDDKVQSDDSKSKNKSEKSK
ncbi:MAG: deoxyhypusine synthase [Candidatus Woesearchaeota archaeon]|jgi:deoxyhypusine synthase